MKQYSTLQAGTGLMVQYEWNNSVTERATSEDDRRNTSRVIARVRKERMQKYHQFRCQLPAQERKDVHCKTASADSEV